MTVSTANQASEPISKSLTLLPWARVQISTTAPATRPATAASLKVLFEFRIQKRIQGPNPTRPQP